MRLNPVNGKAALGISTVLSVDGVVPTPLVGVGAQRPRWLDAAGNVLVYVNMDTSEIQSIDLDTDTVTPLLAGEASRLGAGNLVWVRSNNLSGVDGASFANWGPFPNAGLADVDESGRFALIQDFAGDRGLVLYDAGGFRVFALDEPLTAAAVPRARTSLLAFAAASGQWRLVSIVDGSSIAFAPRTVGVIEAIPLELSTGQVVVIERTSDDTLTIRAATSGTGYVVSSSIVYNPDAIELTPGVVRIGWSATEGEEPTALRMVDLNLNTGGNTRWTSASGTLVSSTGTTFAAASFGVGPVVGGDGTLIPLPLPTHPLTDPQGYVTPPWRQYFGNTSTRGAAAIDLGSRVTGVLPEGNGGTGGNTGTSVINGSNITQGTIPQAVKSSQYDISTTGTANNVFFNAADLLRADSASPLTITGLLAGVGGQQLVIVAADADVTLAHDSGSSSAANRLVTFSGADVTLAADEGALLEYDATEARWRVVAVSSVAVPAITSQWFPLVDGAEPPALITDGAGVLIAVAYPL